MAINTLIRSTNLVKVLLEKKLSAAEVVVDATMGNGKDTLFLCQQVLPRGTVYAFDIQDNAVNGTLKLLKGNGYQSSIGSKIHCIHDSHEHFSLYIKEAVDVFMYNLGYLPGSDGTITTTPNATLKSLDSAISLLKKDGIISIIVYHGHKEGKVEKEAIDKYLAAVSGRHIKIFQGTMPYNDHSPPIIYLIEKVRE